MVEAKTRRFATVVALLAGMGLSGCEVSQDGGEFPPPATETFTALYFSTAAGSAGSPWPYQPWPTDTLFSGTTDGTINIPSALADNPAAAIYLGTPLAAALNTLDGFSTSAFTTTPFSRPIDGSTLTASTVRVVELNMVEPNRPSSTAPVRRVLAQAGVPVTPQSVRASIVEPYLAFIAETLAKYPTLRASRLYTMVRERGYPGAPDHFRALVAG